MSRSSQPDGHRLASVASSFCAEAGSFIILRFPEHDLPDVVYLEQLTSALYLDKREDSERYSEVMERLSVESEPPEKTADILNRILEEVDQ